MRDGQSRLTHHPDVGSLNDLTNRANLRDAAARFNRAEQDGSEALSAWAKRYGRPALIALEAAFFAPVSA